MTRSSRWVPLALAASFLLPFLLGSLAYQQGWFAGGRTNKGELLTPPVALDKAAVGEARQWRLIQVEGPECAESCLIARDTLRRLQETLGRDRDRVSFLRLPAGPQLQADRWYIADPMGWVMLRYEAPRTPEEALRRAQDVLDDLHKLLKVSRIG